MKLKLQDALAVLAVHAGRLHNPPLSAEDAATLQKAGQVVLNHSRVVLKGRRSKPKEQPNEH